MYSYVGLDLNTPIALSFSHEPRRFARQPVRDPLPEPWALYISVHRAGAGTVTVALNHLGDMLLQGCDALVMLLELRVGLHDKILQRLQEQRGPCHPALLRMISGLRNVPHHPHPRGLGACGIALLCVITRAEAEISPCAWPAFNLVGIRRMEIRMAQQGRAQSLAMLHPSVAEIPPEFRNSCFAKCCCGWRREGLASIHILKQSPHRVRFSHRN